MVVLYFFTASPVSLENVNFKAQRKKATFFKRKPDWVRKELRTLLLHMPNVGVRKVADTFNQIHGERETISKSFVYNYRKQHGKNIHYLRALLKHQIPRPQPINHTWAMDMTGLPVATLSRKQTLVLGILDHASRFNMVLTVLEDKSAWSILKELVNCCRRFGIPQAIRTDNEVVFCSRVLRAAFFLLGIQHQKSEVACPWQNGRIERFFGTLKQHAKDIVFDSTTGMKRHLKEFQFFYNCVRPHQHLTGLTPLQVLTRQAPQPHGRLQWVSLWEGRLSGVFRPK